MSEVFVFRATTFILHPSAFILLPRYAITITFTRPWRRVFTYKILVTEQQNSVRYVPNWPIPLRLSG